MQRIVICALLVTVISAGGWGQKAPGTSSTSSARSTVGEAAANFTTAINRQDAAGAATWYTENAVMMPPEAAMFEGREKITAYLKEALDAGLSDYALIPIVSWSSGNTGYEVATYTLSIGTGTKKVKEQGKIILILKRENDRHWRMAYDIWNSDKPASPQ